MGGAYFFESGLHYFFFIILYFSSRFVFESVVKTEITNVVGVSIATYSAICGIMFGRILGLFRVIHELHKNNS